MIGGFFFAQCQKDLACRDATIDINEHVAIINCRIIEAIRTRYKPVVVMS